MHFDWGSIPPEFLLPALSLLPPEDVCRASAVNRRWRQIAVDDRLWRRHCRDTFIWSGERPKVMEFFHDEFCFFKNRVPRTVKTIIDDYYYPLKQVTFSPDGSFMAVMGLPAYICIYDSATLELMDERCMQEALKWSSIESVHFSPDSRKVLLNGIRPSESRHEVGEVVVYEITDESEVHFLCRIPSSPATFHGHWFDSEHLLISELHKLATGSIVASSISELYLVTLPAHRNACSQFFPLLRFLNRHAPVRWPLIAAAASPRFRRVVQLSQQARLEQKSLAEKISELELSGAVHLEGDLTELREVLDKEQQCFRCYLKHQLTAEEYGTAAPLECTCMCHQIVNRLLIFVISDEQEEKIGFKLVGNEIINDALNMRRFKVEEDKDDDDLWHYISRRVDELDHVIAVGGTVTSMKLSADQKQLLVSVDMGSAGFRLRSIDLDKMIIEGLGIHWRGDGEGDCAADIGSNIIVGVRNDRMNIWSRFHLGLPIGEVDSRADAVAVHPGQEYVVTIHDMQLDIWET